MLRSVAVSLVLVGCSSKEIDEASARNAYFERAPKLSVFEQTIERELGRIVPGVVDSDEARARATTQIAAAMPAVTRTVERLVDDSWAVGAEVRFVDPANPTTTLGRVAIASCRWGSNAGKTGRVQADGPNALQEGGRRIGWGLAQTAYTKDGVAHGDADYHPEIDVQWSRPVANGLTVQLSVCFMLDRTSRVK